MVFYDFNAFEVVGGNRMYVIYSPRNVRELCFAKSHSSL